MAHTYTDKREKRYIRRLHCTLQAMLNRYKAETQQQQQHSRKHNCVFTLRLFSNEKEPHFTSHPGNSFGSGHVLQSLLDGHPAFEDFLVSLLLQLSMENC